MRNTGWHCRCVRSWSMLHEILMENNKCHGEVSSVINIKPHQNILNLMNELKDRRDKRERDQPKQYKKEKGSVTCGKLGCRYIGMERLTKAESITIGRHELLVGHNNSNRTNDVHCPSADIGHRRLFLVALHFYVKSISSWPSSPRFSPGVNTAAAIESTDKQAKEIGSPSAERGTGRRDWLIYQQISEDKKFKK